MESTIILKPEDLRVESDIFNITNDSFKMSKIDSKGFFTAHNVVFIDEDKKVAKILECRYIKDSLISDIKHNYNVKYVIC